MNYKVWTEAHARLIKRAASYPEVARIFVHPPIKAELCKWATGERSWLAKVRPYYGHNYHFHIRINCPQGFGRLQEPAAARGPRTAPAAARNWPTGWATSPWRHKPKKRSQAPSRRSRRRAMTLAGPSCCLPRRRDGASRARAVRWSQLNGPADEKAAGSSPRDSNWPSPRSASSSATSARARSMPCARRCTRWSRPAAICATAVLGVASLLLWALILIVTLKYVHHPDARRQPRRRRHPVPRGAGRERAEAQGRHRARPRHRRRRVLLRRCHDHARDLGALRRRRPARSSIPVSSPMSCR